MLNIQRLVVGQRVIRAVRKNGQLRCASREALIGTVIFDEVTHSADAKDAAGVKATHLADEAAAHQAGWTSGNRYTYRLERCCNQPRYVNSVHGQMVGGAGYNDT